MPENKDWMNDLEKIEIQEPELTEAEMQRLTRSVLQRTGQGPRQQGRRAAKTARRHLPVWVRGLLSAAACVVLLAGVNSVQPAVAEGLPVLGDVFAYFNHLSKGYLQGDGLSQYAQPTQLQAESSPAAAPEAEPKTMTAQQNGAETLPYTVTLRQVYCDELYLRVGLVLTASDDSLAGFDAVTIDPPLLYEDTSREEANTLYGGATMNGQAIGGDLIPCFRKQDDQTFFCEMQYNLQNYTGSTQDIQVSLTFSNLVGVTEGSKDKTPLEGTYNLNFTVSEDASLTRVGQIQGGEQNGIRLISLESTPGETCITYGAESVPEGVSLYPQMITEDGTSLEWVREMADTNPENVQNVWKCYFDAVPESVTTLTVRIVDKNKEEQPALAEWTVTLPQ